MCFTSELRHCKKLDQTESNYGIIAGQALDTISIPYKHVNNFDQYFSCIIIYVIFQGEKVPEYNILIIYIHVCVCACMRAHACVCQRTSPFMSLLWEV